MQKIVFWKDREKKLVDPLLFSKIAEDLARETANAGKLNRKSNKRSQIRKFYDEVVRLDGLARSNRNKWEHIRPLVHMIVAKAAYAHGRDRLISKEFLDFLRNSIEQIDEPEDLKLFANFFEAFMGFYRLHGPAN